MRTMLLAGLTLLLAILCSRAGGAPSDETPPGEAPTAEAPSAEDLEEIREKVHRGRHRAARRALDEILEATPDHAAALTLRGGLGLLTGTLDEAEKDLARAIEKEAGPEATELLVELLLRRGRVDEALTRLEAEIVARPASVRAVVQKGRALRLRGRRAEAREVFRSLLKRYNKDPFTEPRDRLDVAVSTIHLAELVEETEVDLSPSMRMLDRLTRDNPELVDAFVVKGDLLVKWHRDVDARKEYRKALRVDARHAQALRGMAESYAFRMDLRQAARHVSLALRTDAKLVDLLCFQAGVKLGDYEYDAAKELLGKALEVNPNSSEARSLLAAMAFLIGDRKTFDAEAEKVLAFDPMCGAVYHTLAQLLESHRRFTEAAEWARKAMGVDPRDWAAAFTLGRNLLNIGKEEEAFEVLERAESEDPYPHKWRKNYLELYDAALSKFLETKTEHFTLRMSASESRLLRDLIGNVMERSYTVLCDKYGYEMPSPVLVEVFHVHADFAARTIGMPGLGALGACFGPVITLDSPSARDAGTFAWAATAWHEFAHSVTLGLSEGRVPRWFTEGLSVYEERRLGAHYERRLERQLYDRLRNGTLPEIARFNSWFRGGDVLFAYFLGGLMCEYIAEEKGFEKLPAMLRLYAENQRDAQVFQEALGMTLEEFDGGFRGWVERFSKDWKLTPRWDNDALNRFRKAVRGKPGDFDAQISLAEAFLQRGNQVDAGMALARAQKLDPEHPRVLIVRGHLAMKNKVAVKAREFYRLALAKEGGEDYDARLAYAGILKAAGDIDGAKESYEIAKRSFPFGVAAGNPYAELAGIHTAEGDMNAALEEKRRLATLVETDIETRVELAGWARQQGDLEQAAEWLDQIVMIYPLRIDVDEMYARVLRSLKRWDDASLYYRMTVELKRREEEPEGLADTHAELAEVEHMRGRNEEARVQARLALEIDPEHAKAKAVLQRLQ